MSSLNALREGLTSSLKNRADAYQYDFRTELRQEGLKADFVNVTADTERPKYNPGTVPALRLKFLFLVRTTLAGSELVAQLAKMGLDAQCMECYILRDAKGWLLVQTVPMDLNF